VQGTLSFAATGIGSDCSVYQGALPSATFAAVVSWLDPATAAVCVDRPLSDPKVGPRSGDAFTVASTGTAALGAVGTCPCLVDVLETLSGTLQRDPTGKVVGLAPGGSLVAALSRDPAADACYASADAGGSAGDCPPPAGCETTYAVRSPP
jgi:hypothetical protein